MLSDPQQPALVIGYRRPGHLETLLTTLMTRPVSKIYVAIDGAVGNLREANQDCVRVAHEVRRHSSIPLYVCHHRKNYGLARNVLWSINWLFQNESSGLVLEDDCVPSTDFVLFAHDMMSRYRNNQRTWLVAGSQIAPSHLFDGDFTFSRYPLIWGWATQRDWWKSAEQAIARNARLVGLHLGLTALHAPIDDVYWSAGQRRSIQGLVDSWALQLAYAMHAQGARSIAPSRNLVTNTGFSGEATHTQPTDPWIGKALSQLPAPYIQTSTPMQAEIDKWLRANLYEIRSRRRWSIFTNFLCDYLWRLHRARDHTS